MLRAYYAAAVSVVQSTGPSVHELGESERRDARVALKEARIRVEDALGSCLLPSLQLLPANPAVGLEIWEVMSLLPYEVNLTPTTPAVHVNAAIRFVCNNITIVHACLRCLVSRTSTKCFSVAHH